MVFRRLTTYRSSKSNCGLLRARAEAGLISAETAWVVEVGAGVFGKSCFRRGSFGPSPLATAGRWIRRAHKFCRHARPSCLAVHLQRLALHTLLPLARAQLSHRHQPSQAAASTPLCRQPSSHASCRRPHTPPRPQTTPPSPATSTSTCRRAGSAGWFEADIVHWQCRHRRRRSRGLHGRPLLDDFRFPGSPHRQPARDDGGWSRRVSRKSAFLLLFGDQILTHRPSSPRT